MKRIFATIIVVFLIITAFSPSVNVYAATDREELEKQIITARAELNDAIQAQLASNEKVKKGSLGFIEYELTKKGLSTQEQYDLNQAKKIIEEAMEEDFTKWYGGDNTGLPAYRNGKVTVPSDRNDATSLDNMEAMFVYLRDVNDIRATDDLYVGPVKRNPGKTNFYIMAIAQTGADRAAGLKRHSSLKTSCENLAFGQSPYIWVSEKGNFKKAMEALKLTKLSSEDDINNVSSKADELGLETGHYTNLFWAVDQVMGEGFTNYSGTNCYNATKLSNYSGKYAVYTIDEFEALYNEYYATVDPEKFQAEVDKKQQALDTLLDEYYATCPGHEFGADTTVNATCTEEGYTKKVCRKCGYTEKTNTVPALGHNLEEGVCSRCGLKTVIKITQINWREGNYTNATFNQAWEVGKELDFSISYTTASDYKWGDEFVIDISDPSVLEYTPSTNCTGIMRMLKVGTCTVNIYAKNNPDTLKTVEIDVTDVGGHSFVITPSENGETDTIATCSKCGKVMNVTVPTINRVGYGHDGSSYGFSTTMKFEPDSVGYLSINMSGQKYYSWLGVNNNEIVIESDDESIVKLKSISGTSNIYATLDIGKHGKTKLKVYPKYNPGAVREYDVIVMSEYDKKVTAITLDKTKVDLNVDNNKNEKLTATIEPEDAFITDIEWTSSNEAVAVVDNEGNITALKKGYSYIRAYATDGSGKYGACGVYVYENQPAPEVTSDDFTTTEKKISTKLTESYEYRMRKAEEGAEWSSWSTYGTWSSLSVNTEYEIGVRLPKSTSEYLDVGEETVVKIKTNDHTPEIVKGKPATCTKAGTSDYTRCEICGAIIVPQEVVPASGHKWDDGEVSKAATCIETGIMKYTCTECGETKEETIELSDHEPVYEDEIPATCTKPGRTGYSYCKNCSEILTESTEIPAKGHQWDDGIVTRSATCKEKGLKVYTCSICDETREEELDMVEHDPVVDDGVAPGCETTGLTEGTHCRYCNEILTEQTVIPALGHDEVHVDAQAPTCTVDGHTAYSYCRRCEKSITEREVIPSTGHKWDNGIVTKAPTEEETGIRVYTCKNCGETYEEELSAVDVPDPLYVISITGNPDIMKVGEKAKLQVEFSRELTEEDGFDWVVTGDNTLVIADDGTITAFASGVTEIGYVLNGTASENRMTITVYGKMKTPARPVVEEVTTNSITVKRIDGVVFSLDAVNWQESNVFEGLDADRDYTVFARAVASGYDSESDISRGTRTHTEKIEELWPFNDVNKNAALADEVKFAFDNGIIGGFGKQDENGQISFRPERYVTRAQFAIMIYNLAGKPGNTSGAKGFTDVDPGTDGYMAILWASSKGIISGFADGRFKPAQNIGRAQIAIMLKKYADYCRYQDMYIHGSTSIEDFDDFSEIKSGSGESLQWALDHGILSGNSKNKLNPNGIARRDQCAACFARFYARFEE
ncbi:MAG: S-layer homology domain-containing protein [Eubacterium sp.]|nr:S-layer homology domain-containing protein [Eubacterium sp.]